MKRSHRRGKIIPYFVVTPGLLFLIFMALYPLIFSLRISFYDWNLLDTEHAFVGLRNFKENILSLNFWHALWITVLFTVVAVSVEFVIGLVIALYLHRIIKGRRIFQTVLLLPIVVAPAIAGLMWRFMLNYEYGVINYFFTVLRMQRYAWLASKNLALPALMITDIWQWTPFMTIILLAGLQSLPDDPLEAAAIDGCSRWQTFWFIILPMLKPVATIAIVLRTIDAFRVYDIIFMMTRGGPVHATTSLSWLIYETGFKTFELHQSASMSWLMLIFVTVIITYILKFTGVNESRK